MEPSQRDHIRRNLLDLQQLTACHIAFIAYLVSRNVISDFDAECLKTIDNRFEKAAKFYEIIVNRKDSYKVVLEALEETCQTGALAILNQLGNSPGASQNATQQWPKMET